jgi:hypothetical protein
MHNLSIHIMYHPITITSAPWIIFEVNFVIRLKIYVLIPRELG